MLHILTLEIDDHILDKIESKHGIRFEEAEEICASGDHHVRRGKEGLYKIFGRTRHGRYILVVLVNKTRGNWRIVTSREMTDTERKLYKHTLGEK